MSHSNDVSSSRQGYTTALTQIRRTDLKSSAKAVAFALLTRAGNKMVAWPSLKTLAGDAGLSVRCVRSCLRLLEQAEIITTIPRHRSDGSHTSNAYRFICSAGAAPVAGHEDTKENNENMPVGDADQIDPKRKKTRRTYSIEPQAFKKALSAWTNYEVARKNRWVDDSEASLIDFFACWAKCRRLWMNHKCENPGGLLVAIIKRQAIRKFYSNEDEAAGMHALKHLRQQGIPAFC